MALEHGHLTQSRDFHLENREKAQHLAQKSLKKLPFIDIVLQSL